MLDVSKGEAMKSILVGLDGSAASLAALAWGGKIARSLGANVIAATVFDVEHLVAMSGGYALANTSAEQWRNDLQRDIDGDWTKPLRDSGANVSTVVAEGHPADVLMRLAKQHDTELIVVGSRGRGSLRELFLGSVSHSLTLRAPCPVVVVPHELEAPPVHGG